MKQPFFRLFVNNWLASGRVSAMSPEQEGAYFRLLCHQWNSETQTIPSDDEALAGLSRLGERWKKLKGPILICFKKGPAQSLRNERLWVEFKKARTESEINASKGRKGMEARWGKRDQPADTEHVKCHSTAIAQLLPGLSPTITEGLPQHNLENENENESKNPPISPKGDGQEGTSGQAGNARRRGLTREQKKRLRVANNTPLMSRMNSWFDRRPDTLWTVYCADALDELLAAKAIEEGDLAIVGAYHMGKAEYRRRNLETLLNNWDAEVSRAREWIQKKKRPGAGGAGGKVTPVWRGYEDEEEGEKKEGAGQGPNGLGVTDAGHSGCAAGSEAL